MAYCRWSTDNGDCDLYVFEHAIDRRKHPDKHVWCLMVAERKFVWDGEGSFDEAVDIAKAKPPGDTTPPYAIDYFDDPAMAPHAGETYYFEDQHELVAFAEKLERLGYRGPSFGWERFIEEGPHIWMCKCGRGQVVCVNGHPHFEDEDPLCLKCCDEGRASGFGCPELDDDCPPYSM